MDHVINIEQLTGLEVQIPAGEHLREARCPGCQALWHYEYIFKGVIVKKCHSCKGTFRISYKHKNNAIIKSRTKRLMQGSDADAGSRKSKERMN